jgi:uncharacterized membrane protein YeaQ/YmgE (transglycosylase-associated protein family)
MEWMWVLLLGGFGGVLNCILIDAGFRLPFVADRVVNPGFVGNILLGVGAALATFLLGTDQLDQGQTLGIALIAGVGGGGVLTALVQKHQTGVLQAQIDQLEKTVRTATGTTTPPHDRVGGPR